MERTKFNEGGAKRKMYITKCIMYLLFVSTIILLSLLIWFPTSPVLTIINPLHIVKIKSSLTFWGINLHHGCRVDTATLLQGLNQAVVIADHSQRHTYYHEALNRSNIIFPADQRPLAPFMYSHKSHSDSLSENNIKEFFNYYRTDPLMKRVHAFFCSFPTSICEIYMPFNRTIIWLPAHRFTLGRCSRPEIDRIILHMQQSARPEQQPKHFVTAGGRYDQEYIKYYTGLDAILLPVNSLWYAFNVTNFTQTKTEILVGPLQLKQHSFIANMTAASVAMNSSFRFSTAKRLYGAYQLQQLTNHRAIILLPYAVLSYGITELYALGIPIFVPSIEFIVKLGLVRDRTLIDPCCCGRKLKFSDMPKQHPQSNHPHSPEDVVSSQAITYWLQFADYYQLPYIQTFTSWTNLIEKLSKTNFNEVYENMFKENIRRKKYLTKTWNHIFDQIDSQQRLIPENYEIAIKELWNTTQLQVF